MSAGRYLTPDEQDRLLAALPSPRDRLLAVLALHTGFRVSELLSLRWRQLIDASGAPLPWVEVQRRNLKGGRSARRRRVASRRLPLNQAAAAAIREYAFSLGKVPAPERWVFASRKRWPGVLSRRQAHAIIAGAAHRAELAGPVGPHGCRRSFAIGLYKLTRDLLAVQALLGHSDPLVTAAYLNWGRDEELQEMVLRLGGGSRTGLRAESPVPPVMGHGPTNPAAKARAHEA